MVDSFAQVIDIHPQSNPEGRILTQAEATLGRGGVYPSIPNLSEVYASPEFSAPRTAPSVLAFSQRGSLYIIERGDTTCVAASEADGIVYGETVSRNEFGIDGGIFFSPSKSKLAFYRKDESRVTKFPLLNIKTRTGSLREIRYPMAGMASEYISLGVFDRSTRKTVYLDVTDFTEERYITNVSWSSDERYIYAQVLDRSQHDMHLNMYRADNGKFVRTLLQEHNDKWVEPLDPCYALPGRSDVFIYRTDNRDGYRNLYLVDTLGSIRRMTAVDADVAFAKADDKYVYYTSAEVSPVENHLFRVKVGRKGKVAKISIGKPQRLTPERGWHSIRFSPNGQYFLDVYSSFNTPRVADLRTVDGKLVRNVGVAEDPFADRACCEVEFGKVPSADGRFDNYYRLYKPLNFDPSKKYPLIVYVYGGPHSQMVNDTWLGNTRLWEMYMAQRGYVVYVQDNRGTQNRGAEFEKAINRYCGVEEMKDQMVGINRLISQPWVDAERVGVHGWSYGGFMTISLLTTYPEVFKVGVAGGPVIDWKWYEVMYGERYMDNPDTNPEGFKATSLIEKATNLKGKLLICQGAIDNTVVWEHSLSFVQKCIENDIQLDYFPYPVSEHNVIGKWRTHLMDKVSDYFFQNL